MRKKLTHRTIICLLILMALNFSAFASDIPSLIKDLGDSNKDKAKKASEDLALIGKPAVPELIKALSSKRTHQRRYSARALRQIGQDASDAIPTLSKSIEDSDTETRIYAAEALGNMNQQAKEVIPLLQKATRDKNKDVREAVEAAIKKLQSYPVDKTGIEKRVKERLNQHAGKKCLSVQLEQESPNKHRGFVEFEDGSKVGITVTINGTDLQYSFAEVGKDASGNLAVSTHTPQESGYAHVEWKFPDLNEPAYYAVFVNSHEVGYAVITRISDRQRVITSNIVSLSIKENNSLVLSTYVMEKHIETLSGEPLGFEYEKFVFETGKSVDRVKMRGTVSQQGKINFIKRTIEGDVKHILDWPKGALMSEGERLFFSQKKIQEGQEYSIRQFTTETLGAENTTIRIGKKKNVSLIGGEALLTVVLVTKGDDVYPSYVDDHWGFYKGIIPLEDANDFRFEIVACSKEHVGNNIQKTEFQRDYELLEEETSEFISQNSVKLLNTMAVIDVKRIWNKWTDLQGRWMWTLKGQIPEDFKNQVVPLEYIFLMDPVGYIILSNPDYFPKIDFMSPKVFYKVFGKPERTQIVPADFAWDRYYFWYECKDGSIGIEVYIHENTKERYEVLIVGKDIMSF